MENKTPVKYIAKTKISASNNKKGKSFTFSTVIPKPIVNNFGLMQKQNLYWIIENDKIVITPETEPDKTQEAGNEILKDIIFNDVTNYSTIANGILVQLNKAGKLPDETIKETILDSYENDNPDFKAYYKNIVNYLLGNITDSKQLEILKEINDEITKTD